jgi:heme-degrading monooxygenase HmoA
MSSLTPPVGTVVRSWTGWIRTEDREAYRAYLDETGLRDYRATRGNLGAYALYAEEANGRTRVTTVSYWTDIADVARFAGEDISAAVFYPEDDRYLVARETTVSHAVVSA